MNARVSQAEAIIPAPCSASIAEWDGAEPGRLTGRGLLLGRVAFLATLTALVTLNIVALPGIYAAFFPPAVICTSQNVRSASLETVTLATTSVELT